MPDLELDPLLKKKKSEKSLALMPKTGTNAAPQITGPKVGTPVITISGYERERCKKFSVNLRKQE